MAIKKTVGELVYRITGDSKGFSSTIQKTEDQVKGLKKTMDTSSSSVEKMTAGFRNFGLVVKGAIVGFITTKLVGFLSSAVQEASLLYEQQTRLAQILRVSTNATDEQIRSLRDQAEELETVGILNKEIVTTVQAQLATFDLQANTIKSLTPAILDYVAAEKGINATTDEAQSLTNGLAQALNGNFASLTKVGFVLDEHTKKLIANGTEAERAAALSDVLNSTYEGMNQTLAGTFLGTMARTQRAFGDLKEDIGFALMPALQVLGEEIIGVGQEMKGGSERVNTWGKAFYRLSQIVIVVAKTFKIFGLGVKSAMIIGQSAIATFLEQITQLRIVVGKLRGQDVADLEAQKESYKTLYADLANELTQNGEEIIDTSKEMGEAMSEALDPKKFKPVTDAAIAAYKKLNESTTDVGDSSEEAKKKLEDFQKKLLDTIDTARDAQTALGEDLNKAFEKFGEDLKSNAEDTVKGLGEIVVGAEQSIKDLKAQLKETDDADSRKDIKKQIKDQEAILKARKDFEEREAARVTELRTRLEEAGIDAAKAGVDGLLEVRDLEAEIQEQRRVASLDEFTRFEEQQIAKREALVTALIEEVNLINEKIEKQKELESDVTSFLLEQNTVREESVREFADAAIAKYGEMASSLRSAISLQERLNSLRSNPKQFHDGGYVGADGGEVHAGEYVVPAGLVSKYRNMISGLESERRSGSTINNSKTVNAPINIQATMNDSLDFTSLSKELAWQIGRK